MSVSGSTDNKSTAIDLIQDARALLGIHTEEEPMDENESEMGRRILTKMLKAWEADGVGATLLTEGSLTLVSSQASYLFGAGGDFTTVPFEIVSARIYRTSDIPMWRLSREEYQRIPNKTATGYPTQFFYDRQRDNGSLYVWPTPDSSAGTFKFTYRRRIMDIDANADNFDLPPEWEEAITYNLAMRLQPTYGLSSSKSADDIRNMAKESYLLVKMWDTGAEEGSVYFSPDDQRYGVR
jgi:hypothetical protein